MSEAGNRRVVERLVEDLNAGDVGVINDIFTDDSMITWPQSGEVIRGRANRQAIYGAFRSPPTIALQRLASGGDLATAEATLDCGDAYQVVFIFEFRNGLIARETAYWSKPFPAPEWRARWVERASE